LKFIKTKTSFFRRLCVGLLGWALAHAQAQTGGPERYLQGRAEGANVRIEVLGAGFAQPGAVASTQSRLVIYRPGPAGQGNDALTVLVNGRYHASLVEAAHSDACVAPGPVRLGLRRVRVADGGRDGQQQELAMQLQPGAMNYVKVQAGQLQPVPPEQAQLELQGSREQVHTISRLAQVCQVMAPAPLKPGSVQQRQLVLLADSTFAFGRADEGALTGMGRLQIQHLIARLREEFEQVDRIHVVGHADPLGSAQANEQLALARAQTVQRMLQGAMGRQTLVEVRGVGAREPLVQGCPMQTSETAIRCHAPNRRVSIEATGLAREGAVPLNAPR